MPEMETLMAGGPTFGAPCRQVIATYAATWIPAQ